MKRKPLRRVRLSDVPVHQRIVAARLVVRQSPADASEIIAAALFPSDTIYYVCAEDESAPRAA